ncbi:MAG: hypothetical protein ABWW69_02405 [Pyrodictiaceae archaeon]
MAAHSRMLDSVLRITGVFFVSGLGDKALAAVGAVVTRHGRSS